MTHNDDGDGFVSISAGGKQKFNPGSGPRRDGGGGGGDDDDGGDSPQLPSGGGAARRRRLMRQGFSNVEARRIVEGEDADDDLPTGESGPSRFRELRKEELEEALGRELTQRERADPDVARERLQKGIEAREQGAPSPAEREAIFRRGREAAIRSTDAEPGEEVTLPGARPTTPVREEAARERSEELAAIQRQLSEEDEGTIPGTVVREEVEAAAEREEQRFASRERGTLGDRERTVGQFLTGRRQETVETIQELEQREAEIEAELARDVPEDARFFVGDEELTKTERRELLLNQRQEIRSALQEVREQRQGIIAQQEELTLEEMQTVGRVEDVEEGLQFTPIPEEELSRRAGREQLERIEAGGAGGIAEAFGRAGTLVTQARTLPGPLDVQRGIAEGPLGETPAVQFLGLEEFVEQVEDEGPEEFRARVSREFQEEFIGAGVRRDPSENALRGTLEAIPSVALETETGRVATGVAGGAAFATGLGLLGTATAGAAAAAGLSPQLATAVPLAVGTGVGVVAISEEEQALRSIEDPVERSIETGVVGAEFAAFGLGAAAVGVPSIGQARRARFRVARPEEGAINKVGERFITRTERAEGIVAKRELEIPIVDPSTGKVLKIKGFEVEVTGRRPSTVDPTSGLGETGVVRRVRIPRQEVKIDGKKVQIDESTAGVIERQVEISRRTEPPQPLEEGGGALIRSQIEQSVADPGTLAGGELIRSRIAVDQVVRQSPQTDFGPLTDFIIRGQRRGGRPRVNQEGVGGFEDLGPRRRVMVRGQQRRELLDIEAIVQARGEQVKIRQIDPVATTQEVGPRRRVNGDRSTVDTAFRRAEQLLDRLGRDLGDIGSPSSRPRVQEGAPARVSEPGAAPKTPEEAVGRLLADVLGRRAPDTVPGARVNGPTQRASFLEGTRQGELPRLDAEVNQAGATGLEASGGGGGAATVQQGGPQANLNTLAARITGQRRGAKPQAQRPVEDFVRIEQEFGQLGDILAGRRFRGRVIPRVRPGVVAGLGAGAGTLLGQSVDALTDTGLGGQRFDEVPRLDSRTVLSPDTVQIPGLEPLQTPTTQPGQRQLLTPRTQPPTTPQIDVPQAPTPTIRGPPTGFPPFFPGIPVLGFGEFVPGPDTGVVTRENPVGELQRVFFGQGTL